MCIVIGIPNQNDENADKISKINWQNIRSYTSKQHQVALETAVIIPPKTTAAVIFYSSASHYTNASNYYIQFLHWYVYKMRTEFFIPGEIEIDTSRTLKALHSPGLENTYEIWR